MQGWVNIWKSNQLLERIDQLKDIRQLKDVQKSFDEIQHPFLIKNFQQSKNLMELYQSRNGNGIYENL